jgi:hypothetical protein
MTDLLFMPKYFYYDIIHVEKGYWRYVTRDSMTKKILNDEVIASGNNISYEGEIINYNNE